MREEDVRFLVSLLNPTDREEFYEMFADEYENKLSRTARYKLSRGIIHLSDDNIIELALDNKRALEWIISRVKVKCNRVNEILSNENVSSLPS